MSTLFNHSNGVYYISYEEHGKLKARTTDKSVKTEALKELIAFDKPRLKEPNKISLQDFVKDFLHDAESSFSPAVRLFSSRHFNTSPLF